MRAHGTLEAQSAALWRQAFLQVGGQLKVAERLPTGWRFLLDFTLATVMLVFVFLRYGTPIVAAQLAHFVPLCSECEQALRPFLLRPVCWSLNVKAICMPVLSASCCSCQSGCGLGQATSRCGSFRLGIGPNALVLSGGTVIMTDEMVQLAQMHGIADAALLGIFVHEVAHVQMCHSSRVLIEQGLLNACLSVAVGDVSDWLALASTSLTSMAISRAHEREADCFTLALLGQHAVSSESMAELFGKTTEADTGKAQASEGSGGDWLATHPDSQLRTSAFVQGRLNNAVCVPGV